MFSVEDITPNIFQTIKSNYKILNSDNKKMKAAERSR